MSLRRFAVHGIPQGDGSAGVIEADAAELFLGVDPCIPDPRQFVFRQDTQRAKPGDMDEEITRDACLFPEEERQQRGPQQKQHCHCPYEHPESIEEHARNTGNRVGLVFEQSTDVDEVDAREDHEHPAEHDRQGDRFLSGQCQAHRTTRIVLQPDPDAPWE